MNFRDKINSLFSGLTFDALETIEEKKNTSYKEGSLDKVNPDALKKNFKDRKDKDIDNDGDVDDSDEYLHNRRKTIKKAIAKESLDEESKTIASMRKIVADKQAMKVDGVMVDMFTASAVTQIYDKVNDANKAKLDGMKASQLANIAYKMMKKEEVEIDEAAPKLKGDYIKTQREKDRAHDAAMGRTATGRKKPQRAMTSTQRSLASMRKEDLDENKMTGNYARVMYDYREDYYNITVYKNGKEVASDDGYFGANETGNPLIKKFTDIVKKAGLKPEGLPIVDEDGKKGVFKGNTFKWNTKEEVELDEAKSKEEKIADLEKMLKGISGNTSSVKMKKYAIQKKINDLKNEEVELDENMSRVAKELEDYARKNGGIDKMDFMKAAMMMKKGQTNQLKKFVDDLDTEPREKILSLMQKDEAILTGKDNDHLEKKLDKVRNRTQKAMNQKTKSTMEEVELEEKVDVKGIQKAVDDGKSIDVIMTMFANKRTTNTDEIRKVVKDYMWKKRMKKEELDEAKNYEIKDGKVHISKANFRKVHKDYKNATKGQERMMALDPKTGATTSFPVVFTESDGFENSFRQKFVESLQNRLVEKYAEENGIDINSLTEEELDEVIGAIVRGVKKVANRLSTSGRADAAEKRAAAAEKKNRDRERIQKAQQRLRDAQKAAQDRANA